MKKKSKIILSIILFIIIVIIGILVINSQKNSKNIQNEIYHKEDGENYYTITYSTNYDNSKVVEDEEQEYEVVSEKTRLDEILDKVQSKEEDYNFDDDFFRDNNLLVIEAGINPEINKFEITDKKVDIIIYVDVPLTTREDIWDFNIYLIPISKTVEDIHVETLPNPDKVF